MEFVVNDVVQGAFELQLMGQGALRGSTPVPPQASSGDPSPAAAVAVPSLLLFLLLIALGLAMH